MATIALPSSFSDFAEVIPHKRFNSRMVQSPYNYTQQVASLGAQIKIIEVVVPVIDNSSDATEWITFFNSLDGFVNTFNLDLSEYYPGESGLTAVPMRLMNPEQVWNIRPPLNFSFSFTAIEAR